MDFTKLFNSLTTKDSESLASDVEADDKAESNLYLEVSSLNDPTRSISLSTDKNAECNRVDVEPVEVAETRSFGNVSRDVYFSYITAGGSAFKIFCLIIICLLTQTLYTGGFYWINHWYFE